LTSTLAAALTFLAGASLSHAAPAGGLPTAGKPNTKPPPAQVILLQPKVENSHFQFMFQSDAGHDYAVEFVTDLRQTGWLSVTNLSGNGDVIKVVDPDPVSSTRYYRVTAH